jgi:hypothetical protein
LIGVKPDTRAERGLQEARVSGRDTIPPEGIEIGGEVFRWVESALGEPCPLLAREDGCVQFSLPEHLEFLPLSVIFYAGEFDESGILRPRARDQALHQIQALADADDLADFWDSGSYAHDYEILRILKVIALDGRMSRLQAAERDGVATCITR